MKEALKAVQRRVSVHRRASWVASLFVEGASLCSANHPIERAAETVSEPISALRVGSKSPSCLIRPCPCFPCFLIFRRWLLSWLPSDRVARRPRVNSTESSVVEMMKRSSLRKNEGERQRKRNGNMAEKSHMWWPYDSDPCMQGCVG